MQNRGSDSKAIKADAKRVVAKLPLYAPNAAYLDKLIDKHQSAAFDSAYDMGGRRRSATLDGDRYFETLFTRMSGSCYADKKKDLGDSLDALAKLSAKDK
jgi:hypothetical protein